MPEDFAGKTLEGADLGGRDLHNADLSGANLRAAILVNTNLIGANMTGADLSGSNLTGASLQRANLSEANLTGTDLRGAKLTNANLREANLTGANLRDASLGEANLSGADLDGANFEGASLLRAILVGANLTNAYLHGVIWNHDSPCIAYRGINRGHSGNTSCKWCTDGIMTSKQKEAYNEAFEEWKKKQTIMVASIEPITLEGEYKDVPSVSATCSKCGHTTESYGQKDESILRSLAVLREECPLNETNFYVCDEELLERK